MSSSILRHATIAARQITRTRGFASSAVTRAGNPDLVQDLYLREIKGYKPAPKAKDAHVGAVKQFAIPPAPAAPALPADLAADLAAYDAAEPTLEAAKANAASSGSAEASSEATGADAFLSFLEQDIVKPAHH